MDLTDTMKHILSNSGTAVGAPSSLSAANLTTTGSHKSGASSASTSSTSAVGSSAQNAAAAAAAAASLHHLQHQMHGAGSSSAVASTSASAAAAAAAVAAAASAGSGEGTGYVTEKLYMLLQLYLQNKGWNPSVELLQCFSELKDTAMLPSAGYLQVLANRLALDGQGRLVLRESGKIVLPYEHFANAVMLKHMTGPHGLHLSVEATVRAVVESYTIGRECFGMEKEFIIEVVQSCPNPACRYYKNHMGVGPPSSPFLDAGASFQMNSDYMQQQQQQQQQQHHHQQQQQHLPLSLTSGTGIAGGSDGDKTAVGGQLDLSMGGSKGGRNDVGPSASGQLTTSSTGSGSSASSSARDTRHSTSEKLAKQQQQQQQQQHQQQLTAAIMQQQNRAIAQQNLEKFGNLSAIEKQRVLQQLDKKHYEAVAAAAAAAAAAGGMSTSIVQNLSQLHLQPAPMSSPHSHRMSATASPQPSTSGTSSAGACSSGVAHTLTGSTTIQAVSHEAALASLAQQQQQQQQSAIAAATIQPPPPPYKSSDYYRSGGHHSPSPMGGASPALLASAAASTSLSASPSSSVLDSTSATNKELLALHNGAWTGQNAQPPLPLPLPMSMPPLKHDSHQQQQQQMMLGGSPSPGPSASGMQSAGSVPIITMPSDSPHNQQLAAAGQEKIIRAFGELMRNVARMKQYIRPSMCKPYGKQSEGLQKTLADTIQLVQSLRSCLPAPHIPVSSWKTEDRHVE